MLRAMKMLRPQLSFIVKIKVMKNIDLLPLWVYVLCTVSCVKDSDYVINDGIRPDDIIAISSITPVEAFADSSTEILVRVKINAYSSANREITLTTTQGIINYKSQSEALTTNMDKYVDFNLKTGQVAGPVFLRVSVLDDYIRDTVILKGLPRFNKYKSRKVCNGEKHFIAFRN